MEKQHTTGSDRVVRWLHHPCCDCKRDTTFVSPTRTHYREKHSRNEPGATITPQQHAHDLHRWQSRLNEWARRPWRTFMGAKHEGQTHSMLPEKRTQKHAVEWGRVHFWSPKSRWCCKRASNKLFCMVDHIVCAHTHSWGRREVHSAARCVPEDRYTVLNNPVSVGHELDGVGKPLTRAIEWRCFLVLKRSQTKCTFVFLCERSTVSWKKKVVGEMVKFSCGYFIFRNRDYIAIWWRFLEVCSCFYY